MKPFQVSWNIRGTFFSTCGTFSKRFKTDLTFFLVDSVFFCFVFYCFVFLFLLLCYSEQKCNEAKTAKSLFLYFFFAFFLLCFAHFFLVGYFVLCWVFKLNTYN